MNALSRGPQGSGRRAASRLAAASRNVILLWIAVMPAVLSMGNPALAVTSPGSARARGPVGWDVYRHLDLLPYIRRGVQTFQVSSADPTGNNDDGYTGRYSCLHRVPEGCLLAQHRGPGELESVWSAGFFNSVAGFGRLEIELDGRVVVNAPMQDIVEGRLGAPFVFPLVLNDHQSLGGFSINVPMPFRREMRVISQENPHYYHVVYRSFASSQGVVAFASRNRAPDVVAELRRAGTRDPKPRMGRTTVTRRPLRLGPGQQVVVANLRGSGAITQLRMRLRRFRLSKGESAAHAADDALRHVRLLAAFDGARTVDAPLGGLFGSGLGPARVRSLLFAMDGGSHGWASSWWPMPYRSSAVLELRNASRTPILAGDLIVTSARSERWRSALGGHGDAGYFHALGHSGPTRRNVYWTFLATRGTGTFVGVTQTMEGPAQPLYLEGNERAYVDGAARPQIQGTGTEDFYGGGWYFLDRLFSLPLTGYTAHGTRGPDCAAGTCKTAYRVMLGDAVPFTRSIRYEMEHGVRNTSNAIYGSTAYWYQRPSPAR